MYCSHCGNELQQNANFCSRCGASVTSTPLDPHFSSSAGSQATGSRIVRPRSPRTIAGVCSGFALHFGWDLTLVRVLLVVFTLLTSGVSVLVYIALWILLPEAPYALPATTGYQPAA